VTERLRCPPPSATKDITTTSFSTDGRKICTDLIKQPRPPPIGANGTEAIHTGTSQSSDVSSRAFFKQQITFGREKKQQPGRSHQSVAMIVKNNPYCQYKKRPGLNIQKQTTQTYRTNYRCEECSIDKGTDVWLCNTVKSINGKQTKVQCHIRYHAGITHSYEQ
jgi:hypothetical protein